jgi:alkylation response protein AidB-like acyl-CoA dehydrogenase
MDVRLSLEQQALRDSVIQVVQRLGPKAVGQLDDRDRSAKLDAAVASSGWRDLRSSTPDHAPAASAVEVAIVAEELARGLADASFLGPTLAADMRRLARAPASAGPETVVLTPNLEAPAYADNPGVAIDAAGTEIALNLLPADRGFHVGHVAVPDRVGGIDLTRPTAPTASTPPEPVPGQGRVISEEDVARWTALGLATTCADLVGVMRGAVELSVDYARQRMQYGRPIGTFQALQHLLADSAVHTEGSRSAMLHAAWAVDALAPGEALAAAVTAKAYCARAARAVCETAIQVHGGIGNTWECLAHLYLRRALLSTDVLGGIGASLARVLEFHQIGAVDGLQ